MLGSLPEIDREHLLWEGGRGYGRLVRWSSVLFGRLDISAYAASQSSYR
jgi:hypothetical protein